jgi:hypothetical protein
MIVKNRAIPKGIGPKAIVKASANVGQQWLEIKNEAECLLRYFEAAQV